MKSYTLKEVSKKINVSPGTLRKWEEDFEDLLDIPRTKQGARIYTDIEIELLLEIKQMTDKKLGKDAFNREKQSKEAIPPEPEITLETTFEEAEFPPEPKITLGTTIEEAEFPPEPKITLETTIEEAMALNKDLQIDFESSAPLEPDLSLEIISDESISRAPAAESSMKSTELLFEVMENYKETFLSEVKNEIRSVVRKEVLDEVRKEISKGTFVTVKSISDSIYKSTEHTKAEIRGLSDSVEKASEETSDSLKQLSNKVTHASLETSEEIFSLSKQLSETSEELSHYVDVTNNEITSLTEAIAEERELLIEERNHYRQEVTQREVAFQQMLTNFRDVAAGKEKKWWKFWA
ncbi:MerR family transcriptional regulator [Bacillus sp. USDA818B3_A]|uniref:MerR family transcriptional regulator n=1 Tax=Bacillus sp. USDA818B3_A TaxID=2698834 RepID=UPI00136C46BA|nr:MerR family transcriptional regulator [Bacillus sp. USDA818B3_A]